MKISTVLLAVFFLLTIVSPLAIIGQSGDTPEKKTEKPAEQKTAKDSKESKKDPKKEEEKGLFGKEYDEEMFKPKVEEGSYVWLAFKTVLVLGSIVGGFYYFFRFATRKAGIQVLGEDVIQLLSVVPIGQNKFLQVVDIAGKIMVLGVSDNNINCISEVTDKDEIDRIRLLSSKSIPVKGGFQEYMTGHMGRLFDKVADWKESKSKPKIGEEIIEPGVDLRYLKDQKDRLKNLSGLDDE
ncbi:MAG: flagellar biosynthetic protein FliO [bacterium]|nr:flagellar biosynthetic protein FliO [bacterium]